MALDTITREPIVQADGSVTIPTDVLERAGIKPGDEIFFWTSGRGRIVGVMLPDMTIDEMFERFGDPTITEIDWPKLREEAEEMAAAEVIAQMMRHG